MASFSQHIKQANKNIEFLKSINRLDTPNWEWQVTVCFYVAVHIVNAHIAKKEDKHYRSHKKVNDAINPYTQLSISKVSEDCFVAYKTLQSLARRSRYLCHEVESVSSEGAYFTEERHFKKSLKNLDMVMSYFAGLHEIEFDLVRLKGEKHSLSLNYLSLEQD